MNGRSVHQNSRLGDHSEVLGGHERKDMSHFLRNIRRDTTQQAGKSTADNKKKRGGRKTPSRLWGKEDLIPSAGRSRKGSVVEYCV